MAKYAWPIYLPCEPNICSPSANSAHCSPHYTNQIYIIIQTYTKDTAQA